MPQVASKDKAASTATVSNGFTWDDVAALTTQRAEEAFTNQQAFLSTHPDYAPCIIPGCFGTVDPRYVRDFNGQRTGFCPRTQTHDRLKAEAAKANRRSL